MGLIISHSPPLCRRRQASAESPGRGGEWGPGRQQPAGVREASALRRSNLPDKIYPSQFEFLGIHKIWAGVDTFMIFMKTVWVGEVNYMYLYSDYNCSTKCMHTFLFRFFVFTNACGGFLVRYPYRWVPLPRILPACGLTLNSLQNSISQYPFLNIFRHLFPTFNFRISILQ